jgi:lysozyme
MNDNQRGALLSFAYNLGAGFYNSSNFNTISRHLREKNWGVMPKVLEMYRNPGSNVEAGLLRRRVAEGKLWVS